MVRASPNLNSWDAGEFAPESEGRTDLNRYSSACRIMENFIPRVIGPATRRPGFHFAATARYPDKLAVLVPFEYSTEQAYVIEFGDLYVRFYRNDGPLLEAAKTISGATQANPVVLTITGHNYANGDDFEASGVVGMSQLNGRRFRVAGVTTNTVNLTDQHGDNIDGTGYSAYVSAGSAARVYTVVTTYQEEDLFQLKFAQSDDVLYIAHTEYVPRKLQRYGATNWAIQQIDFIDGPYMPLNASQAKLTPGAASGASVTLKEVSTSQSLTGIANNGAGGIRVTFANHGWNTGDRIDIAGVVGTTEANGTWTIIRVSASKFDLAGSVFTNAYTSGGTITPHIFESTDIGRLVRLQHSSTWGWARIVTYVSAVSVTIDIISNFGASTATVNWRIGLYSQGGGYPAAVTFYGGRLYFGGCPLIPTRLDGSMSSNYETYSPSDFTGVVADDNAVAYPLDSGDVNNVVWMKDDEHGLLVGTGGGEWVVRANSFGAALTPTNVNAVRSTTWGSYPESQPVRSGKDVLFVQRKQTKLRNFSYDYQDDGFEAGDLTLLSPHIARSGFGQLAFQSQPEGWVWCVRGDGQVAVLTYDRDEDKIGWSRQVFGGHQDAAMLRPAAVESICCIPDPTDDRDEVWCLVRRVINGQTERYIEFSAAEWEVGDDQEKAFYADSGLIFDGSQPQTLQPGAGADVKGTEGVIFLAGGAVFMAGDVGRFITQRYFDYSAIDPEDPALPGKWRTAKALITAYTSSTSVVAKIHAPFPTLDQIDAMGWRISTDQLSNLWHLEGQTISVNAEGATHPDVVVTNGTAQLVRGVGYAVAGLACPARFQTMRIEAGSQDGTSQGKTKRINEVTLRLIQTLGGDAGPNFSSMLPIRYRTSATPMDQPPEVEDGDYLMKWDKGYDKDGRIAVRQAQPFPMTIAAVLPQVVTYDKG